MDAIIILTVVIIGIVFCIYNRANKNTRNYVDILNVPISEGEEMPLQEKTYKYQNQYNNNAQNQRTDAIIDVLSDIRIWITIIGIYYLLKIIIIIGQIVLMISLGRELTDIFSNLLN